MSIHACQHITFWLHTLHLLSFSAAHSLHRYFPVCCLLSLNLLFTDFVLLLIIFNWFRQESYHFNLPRLSPFHIHSSLSCSFESLIHLFHSSIFLSFRIFLRLVLFVYLPSTHFVASSFPVAFHTSPFSYSTISLLSLIMPPSLVSFNHLSIFLCTPRSFVWFVQPLFPIALYISCFFHSTISLLPLIMSAPLILFSHFRYPFAHFSIRPSPSTHFF